MKDANPNYVEMRSSEVIIEENPENSENPQKPPPQNFLRQQEQLQKELERETDKPEEKEQLKPKQKNKSEKLYIYFCSICGDKSIMANIGLHTLPNRRTDHTIAINMKQIFLQNFLGTDGPKFIKRQTGIEKQYRWKCKECGVYIAYQSIPYEESNQLLQAHESQIQTSNRPYLYVLNDALVINQQFSKLFQEVARLKDTLVFQ